MAEALIIGLVSSKAYSPRSIWVWDINPARLSFLARRYGVRKARSNTDAVQKTQTIFLCVKPSVVQSVAAEISDSLTRAHTVVSIAAGISLTQLESGMPGVSVIRSMPNQPAQVGAGMTVLSLGRHARKSHLIPIRRIFHTVGEVMVLPEKSLDVVTALSGSGPAFFYEIVEALVDAGARLGLSLTDAQRLVVAPMAGAAQTIRQTKKPLAELVAEVASPRGTTEAGLTVMRQRHFRKILQDVVKRAAQRSAEIRAGK